MLLFNKLTGLLLYIKTSCHLQCHKATKVLRRTCVFFQRTSMINTFLVSIQLLSVYHWKHRFANNDGVSFYAGTLLPDCQPLDKADMNLLRLTAIGLVKDCNADH